MRIYTASKLHHAKLMKALEEQWSDHTFSARWVSDHVGNIPDTPAFAKEFWIQDVADVISSDVVLVYVEENDKLRGGLVEAGVAIAHGIPVITIGDHPDLGTWTYHPCVYRVANFGEVFLLMRLLATKSRGQKQEQEQDACSLI